MLKLTQAIAGGVLFLTVLGAQAFEFKTVGAAPAILYDAPSVKGDKQFIAPRGMPLEVVLTYGEWVRVRDVSGALAWTPSKGLSSQRGVVVRSMNVKVRSTAEDTASVVFLAEKGLLLEVLATPVAGWVNIKHKDGLTGYIKNSDVWGI